MLRTMMATWSIRLGISLRLPFLPVFLFLTRWIKSVLFAFRQVKICRAQHMWNSGKKTDAELNRAGNGAHCQQGANAGLLAVMQHIRQLLKFRPRQYLIGLIRL